MTTRLGEISMLSSDISLETIQKLLELTKDDSLSDEEYDAVELAFEKASLLYGLPQSDEEERDWKICLLISRRLNSLQDLAYDYYKEEQHLEEVTLEAEIAQRLLASATEDQTVDRETDVEAAELVIEWSKEELNQIETEVKETEAWITTAREMLATEKYRSLPEECLEVMFSDDEDEEEENDDEEEDGCCGEDGCGGCEEEADEEAIPEGCCGGGCCA